MYSEGNTLTYSVSQPTEIRLRLGWITVQYRKGDYRT